ncbi:MAG: SLC13 family permease [Desulfobulbus sp.]|uniref:SLC13 family permease n=1 Tax=Desulfobulbus sp. TaxID=895 RepID=UPI00284651BC|nr:SLC13 family permease [Desulfobulbus sp.]MDR2549703.1 SLC13 family permease [Desulfobulbus sp.]
MTHLIILVAIILAALVLFIGGWIAVDVTGLLVLSALALTGLVSSTEALAGFSSSAVITVMGMFILTAGLTRTGVAYRLGQPIQRLAQNSEVIIIVALMAAAAILSALINTTTVAAIMLPTTMELARRSGRSPSRLLLPMALGCLLGGPFTGISTPSNILATEALASAGFPPFKLLDFTPITAALVVSGILFVILIGRRILPGSSKKKDVAYQGPLESSYQLTTHLFTLRIRHGSKLAGRTLIESRLGSALFLTVLGLKRRGELILAPRPQEKLQEGDTIIVHGHPNHLQYFNGHQHLCVEANHEMNEQMLQGLTMAETVIVKDSPFIGTTVAESRLRQKYRVHVLSLHTAQGEAVQNVRRRPFALGDRLLLQGEQQALEKLVADGLVAPLCCTPVNSIDQLVTEQTSLLPMRVPDGSIMVGRNLVESRLGNAFGLTVIGIFREKALLFMPSSEEIIQKDDLLILQGTKYDLEALVGLQALLIERPSPGLVAELESQQVTVTEVLLSPRTTLAGQTLANLLFRDHYGLSVLAIWRKGQAHRLHLQDMPLQFGDALLVYGQRQSLEAVARDPNFLVLDKEATQVPLMNKAPYAIAIMIAVLLSAILGYVHISIAALTGAALMVLFGCLTIDEAYRAIEWKVIFLVATMLPLGVAVQNTGAAELVTSHLIPMVGGLGPRWVVAVLFLVTVIGTQVIPTAPLVVLMSPIALSTAASLNISPHLLMMTVAIAASSSYASPLSHPAHLLIMSPGGYRFIDYIKIGVPLTLVIMAVAIWLLPILWPA